MFEQFLKYIGVEKETDCTLIARDGDNYVAIVPACLGNVVFVVLNCEGEGKFDCIRNEPYRNTQDAIEAYRAYLRDEYIPV